jgi:3-phenylpropionate/trans-cinnamate dioxygenase ferredoxin component
VKAWVRVAELSDIPPGQLLRVEAFGRLLCLANVAGSLFAVDDDCTHVSGPLDQGELEGHVLTCPLHLAQFDVRTGQVLRGPARENLGAYRVRTDGTHILVEDPESMES